MAICQGKPKHKAEMQPFKSAVYQTIQKNQETKFKFVS
jgi:hypothetical protein